MVGWLLKYCHYGFDLTDESFYLNWIANPWIYNTSITQFGFIYHPLHWLCNGDISLLRQSNILIIWGLTWLLLILFFKKMLSKSSSISWRSPLMTILAAILSSSSLLYACTCRWLVTPSYNSLTLQSLLLSSIGILLAEKTASRASILGWILLGTSGWLAFMAKPTTAGLLGLAVAIYFLCTGKFNLKLLLISILITIVLFLITALIIDGSLWLFIHRYTLSLNYLKLMQSHNNLFRIDDVFLLPQEKYLLIMSTLFLSLTSYYSTKTKKKILLVGATLPFQMFSLGIVFELIPVQFNIHKFAVLQILAIPLGLILTSVLIMGTNFFHRLTVVHWMSALFFMVLPYIFAFGTNGNYWMHSQMAGIFWIIAGLVIIMPLLITKGSWKILLLFAVGGQLITIILLQISMDFPYRQTQALHLYNTAITIRNNSTELIFPKKDALFFKEAQDLVIQQGFKSQTPIIDLTGQSPGILYALDAKAIGQAWIIGGYPGSNQVAIASLSNVSCKELVTAWILFEPNSSRLLSPSLLENFGIDINQSYKPVVKWMMPKGMGGGSLNYARQQQLLKPTKESQKAIVICEKNKRIHRKRIMNL
jgi:hypothetical protein